MKGIVGRKVGMTQMFTEDGDRVPVTVVDVASAVVVQKKTTEGKDGYNAIKIGYGLAHKLQKEGMEDKWRLSKPESGVFLAAGIEVPRRHVREVRVDAAELDNYEVGQDLTAETFAPGEYIDATGTSKGSGFTGVMKRHNFRGTKASHGVHEFFRHGGSIGMSAYPARVLPGKKMPGQHGNAKVTVQNLLVYKVLPEENLILVRGSIPEIGRASCRERV